MISRDTGHLPFGQNSTCPVTALIRTWLICCLFLTEARKLRKHDPPMAISFHKDICRALLRSEILSHEFAFGPSQRRSDGSISIDANSKVIRVHLFVSQST